MELGVGVCPSDKTLPMLGSGDVTSNLSLSARPKLVKLAAIGLKGAVAAVQRQNSIDSRGGPILPRVPSKRANSSATATQARRSLRR